MRDVVKLLLRPVSVLSLGLSTMGMMVRGGVVNACSAMAAEIVSAHEFEPSKAGALVLGAAANTQVFTFGPLKSKVECTTLTADGVTTAAKELNQKATILYTNCTSNVGGTVDEPIRAEYEFSADETVNILAPIRVLVLKVLFGGNCHVTVSAQNSLKSVKYDNNASGDILLLGSVTGIKSSGAGECSYAEESNGEYKGNALVFIDGGTVSWK